VENLLPKHTRGKVLLQSTVHRPTITGVPDTQAKNVGFISMRQCILPVAWSTGYFALVIVNFQHHGGVKVRDTRYM
jgi:hypothetical protein